MAVKAGAILKKMNNDKLIDSFGREINYLRLSVTDHCNMACTYCREEDDKSKTTREKILSYEEMCIIIKAVHQLGINKIRLTGGEPLLRKDIVVLIKNIKKISDSIKIPMSTNGLLLDRMSVALREAGIRQLNISIDSLDVDRFSKITRGGDLERVIRGIQAAVSEGLHVKLNVVINQANEDEIEDLIAFAIENKVDIRFIETMPIGISGINKMDSHIKEKEILKRTFEYLKKRCYESERTEGGKDAGPSKDYKVIGTSTKIGTISAVSNEFCGSCNRVRITAKGILLLCLGQENSVDLKQEIINGAGVEEIKTIIKLAIEKKPKEHHFNKNLNNIIATQMVEIGG